MSTLVSLTDADQILEITEVVNLVKYSRSSIYRKMKERTFPRSVKLGAKKIGFRLSDIRQYLANLNN